ncbi:hypothetical protein JCM3766R1_000721 [Sporobolomyces carnicolor]
MAAPADGSTLQPIIKRSLSPSGTVSNSALRSPQFSPDPPSPNLNQALGAPSISSGPSTSPSYFSQSHGAATPASAIMTSQPTSTATATSLAPPPTPGILLNKHDPNATTIRERPHSPPILVDPLLRVASPSASDSGFSSEGGLSSPPPPPPPLQAAAPSNAMSDPATAKPALESIVTSTTKTAASPPSPHCHFAPLPKPEERPQSRRSSIVSGRVKPFIPRPPERSDTMSTTGGDDDALSTGEYTPSLASPTNSSSLFHPATSSAEHFSALSQRLSSSLTFAAPTPRHPSSPSRPTSRRSSSSRRSRSPSPPAPRSSSSDHHSSSSYHHHHRDRSHGGSRTHSPNLSRRPSTDALSLHYIEAGAEGGRGGVSLSRQNSKAGSERAAAPVNMFSLGDHEGGGYSMRTVSPPPAAGLQTAAGGGGGATTRPRSTERRSTFDLSGGGGGGSTANSSNRSTPPPSLSSPPPPTTTTTASATSVPSESTSMPANPEARATPPLSSSVSPSSATPTTTTGAGGAIGSGGMYGGLLHGGGGIMLIDKDKEADLHRLMEKAQHGNLDAERAVSPALQAQAIRREKSRERSHLVEEQEGGGVQVVELGRNKLTGADEGDELEQVEEEDEEEEEEEEGEEDDDDEGIEDDDEDNEEDEDEDEEEVDRSREEEDDDEEDEEDEEPAEERKTSKGAAVEVVRWHRDDPPPAPPPSIPMVDPTPSIPEDSVAEEEAEQESAVEAATAAAQHSSTTRPSSTAFAE